MILPFIFELINCILRLIGISDILLWEIWTVVKTHCLISTLTGFLCKIPPIRLLKFRKEHWTSIWFRLWLNLCSWNSSWINDLIGVVCMRNCIMISFYYLFGIISVLLTWITNIRNGSILYRNRSFISWIMIWKFWDGT
jgi:hypothetical protein